MTLMNVRSTRSRLLMALEVCSRKLQSDYVDLNLAVTFSTFELG